MIPLKDHNMFKKLQFSLIAVIVIMFAAYFGFESKESKELVATFKSIEHQNDRYSKNDLDDTDKIGRAFQNKKSDLQVRATGTVVAVLKDDNEGSRHQKFILELSNGQTVLIAHNIDLAPRINTLQKGDQIEFYGEYEYTEKGGVIHWTHHDPQRRHIDGWLMHDGQTYQ